MKRFDSFAFNVSAAAYKGTSPGQLPQIVPHSFETADDGCLRHFIDGQLRAIVPPQGQDDYLKTWPDALPVVRELKAAEASAAASLAADAEAKAKAAADAGVAAATAASSPSES